MFGRGSIGQFTIKTAIVCAAIFLTLWGLATVVNGFVQERIVQVRQIAETSAKIGGRQFWEKVEQAIEKQADPKSDLSLEKKQKLLANIRIIVERWRPFVQEVSAISSSDSKAPAKQ